MQWRNNNDDDDDDDNNNNNNKIQWGINAMAKYFDPYWPEDDRNMGRKMSQLYLFELTVMLINSYLDVR